MLCYQVKLDEEETSNFRDRLLPFIIGLLRTVSKLYAVMTTWTVYYLWKTNFTPLFPGCWGLEHVNYIIHHDLPISVNNYTVSLNFCLLWIYLLKLIVIVDYPLNCLWLHCGLVFIQILNICWVVNFLRLLLVLQALWVAFVVLALLCYVLKDVSPSLFSFFSLFT